MMTNDKEIKTIIFIVAEEGEVYRTIEKYIDPKSMNNEEYVKAFKEELKGLENEIVDEIGEFRGFIGATHFDKDGTILDTIAGVYASENAGYPSVDSKDLPIKEPNSKYTVDSVCFRFSYYGSLNIEREYNLDTLSEAALSATKIMLKDEFPLGFALGALLRDKESGEVLHAAVQVVNSDFLIRAMMSSGGEL